MAFFSAVRGLLCSIVHGPRYGLFNDILAKGADQAEAAQKVCQPTAFTAGHYVKPNQALFQCPDLQFRDNENLAVPVVIEVATHFGLRSDFRKLNKLIDETEFGIQEGFVFDFVANEWHKYSKHCGEDVEKPYWSDVLKIDMRSLV